MAVEFDLDARDFLLVCVFSTIGINASFSALLAGGKPLLVRLAIIIGCMVAQDLSGISVAAMSDLAAPLGQLGGHGTAIAWTPRFADDYGIASAMEIGIARATFGLILAAQFILAVAINGPVVFPAMGRNYDAAVISAGFGGISLGAAPTAMANMAAVTQRHGVLHLAPRTASSSSCRRSAPCSSSRRMRC